MILFRRAVLAVMIVYWAFMGYMTHTPVVAIRAPGGDKLAHFVAYGVLAFLLYLTIWAIRPTVRWIPLSVLLIVMAYGALDEWTQPLVNRVCDFRDWLANVVGAITALVAVSLLRWLVRQWMGPRTREPLPGVLPEPPRP